MGTVDNLAQNLYTGVVLCADHEYDCHFWGRLVVREIYLSKSPNISMVNSFDMV